MSTPQETFACTSGVYTCWMDTPDLLFIRQRGAVSAADITWLITTINERAKQGLKQALADLGDSPDFSAEGRRALSDLPPAQLQAISFYGGTLALRAGLNIIIRALNLTGKAPFKAKFFKTEAEAREWLQSLKEPAAS